MPLFASKPSTQASPLFTPLSFWRVVSLGFAVVFLGLGGWVIAIGEWAAALWLLVPAALWGAGALGPTWCARLACGITGIVIGMVGVASALVVPSAIALLMLVLAVRPDPQRAAHTVWQNRIQEIVRAESHVGPGALSEAGMDHHRGALSDPV